MGQALKKHPGGRPTLYNRAILDKTMEYIENYESYEHVVPTIAGLSKILKIPRDLAYKWMNDERKKEFLYMCSRIMTEQEFKLINGGLTSKYNSNVTKLMLSKHGYSDSQPNQQAINITVNRDQTTVSKGKDSVTIEHDK